MTAETFLLDLIRVNVIASTAVLLVLALRRLALPRLGARLTYWLWVLVPVIVMADFLPARERIVVQALPGVLPGTAAIEPAVAAPVPAAMDFATKAVGALELPALANALLVVWIAVAVALLARSILSTRRAARDPMTGPALVGVLRPALILPSDFATRFEEAERQLILAHENVHRVSGHTLLNACVELARCACWFNPLAHVAAHRIRIDQELACDAAVIAAHPDQRRVYAQALLKTQAISAFLPLGCTWTSRSSERLHERISMLAQPRLSRRATLGGATLIALLCLAAAYTAWAQQPERIVVQVQEGQAHAAKWTPSSQAPAGVLSHQLEGQRHDIFIDLAQKGDIDFVLFGTTDAEMFWWPDRGKAVWESALADIRGVNFGSQGTSPRSLLWRMQNGELDGYQAKFIVVQAGICMNSAANAGRDGATVEGLNTNCRPLIAEIRARQPQARILLLAPFPRGFDDRDDWREISERNATAFAQNIVNEDTVFYADFGERFFLPNGSHNNTMWARAGINGIGVGIQPAAFEAIADELQPWLDRFVR